MAIRATSLEREPSRLLNYDGRYEVFNKNVTFDPVVEHVKRMQPVTIGPRVKSDLTGVPAGGNDSLADFVKAAEEDLDGGEQYIRHSDRWRKLELWSEEGDMITMAISNNTRTHQLRKTVAQFLGRDASDLTFFGKNGVYWKREEENAEVQSIVKVKGVKNFARVRKEYDLPIFVLGAGFGGLVTAMKLLQRGRNDIQVMEKFHDFGGGSWFNIANRHTKLQTEAGSYHMEFFFQELGFPGDMPSWPSRDYLIMMFSRSGRRFGLENYTKFNTKVTKIAPKGKGDKSYFAIYHEPTDQEGECEIFQAATALCWPGNLCMHKLHEYDGEDVFDGYIEYASRDMANFTKCTDKTVVIVGHGAFAIENVRTCLEFDATHVTVVCRRRNITAPKVVSWMVTQNAIPVPGPVMMEALCDVYRLVDWDPWTAYSVTTDAARTKVRIDQGTMFGVTDIYFIAGYYGLMDCIVGDVKKLTYHMMHLKTGKKVFCEAILKTVGVRGDYELDKVLGLKELVGYWVNGNPLFPAITNSLFVQASNFAGFSLGPGLAGSVEAILWFVDNPQDWDLVKDMLPKHNKQNNPILGNALYVYSAAHAASTAIMLNQIPGLDLAMGIAGALKHTKQKIAHPIEQFLEECTSEWEMYCDMCEANPTHDKSKPRPPFPYTKESLERYIWQADNWGKKWS